MPDFFWALLSAAATIGLLLIASVLERLVFQPLRDRADRQDPGRDEIRWTER